MLSVCSIEEDLKTSNFKLSFPSPPLSYLLPIIAMGELVLHIFLVLMSTFFLSIQIANPIPLISYFLPFPYFAEMRAFKQGSDT